MSKKVLVLGGTGAIGIYLVPELVKRNYEVYVTSRKEIRTRKQKEVCFITGNALDLNFLKDVLKKQKFDAIVDFMNYSTEQFKERYYLLLSSCKHYIFLSSYRVFADEKVITENSQRLLDVSTDNEYLKTDEYALAKARQEDLLRSSKRNNWTIVRPAITYSKNRFQLGSLEAELFIYRSLQGKTVLLPRAMMNKTTTLTWAGDVARLISKLVLNKQAYKDDYNIATREHKKWADVLEIYSNVLNMKVRYTNLDKYIQAIGGHIYKYQVLYDRMYDRKLDNSKVLKITGEKQEDFTKLKAGLQKELKDFIKNPKFSNLDYNRHARLDRIFKERTTLDFPNEEIKKNYDEIRYPIRQQAKKLLHPRTRLNKIKEYTKNLKHKTRIRTRTKNRIVAIRMLRSKLKAKNADGAILTLTGLYNYGNIIQRYALQRFLQKKGYKFISYWGNSFGISGTDTGLFRYTSKFVKNYIWTKPFQPQDNYPIYIVGSDQVWRNWGYKNEKDELGMYFLNFIDNDMPNRIAYAASFGQDELSQAMISSSFTKYIEQYVKEFDHISMREKTGIELLKKTWGVEADLVLDPTMLLTNEDYNQIISQASSNLEKVKPVFVYCLEYTSGKQKIVSDILNEKSVNASYILPYELEVLPPIEQWLKNFSESEYIITDSFHGTVFAIIFNKPFLVVSRPDGGISRLETLLGLFGLNGRLLSEKNADHFNYNKVEKINWKEVNKKLSKLRKQSGDWLVHAIENK